MAMICRHTKGGPMIEMTTYGEIHTAVSTQFKIIKSGLTLQGGVAIYISEEENSRIPNATEHIAIPGLQDKYLIGLDMFHQLHCLVC
jgi:hypothetical protein